MKAITCIVLALAACAPNLADETILREDFETVADGKLPAGWVIDGGQWSVTNGWLRGAASKGEATVWFGLSDARDVAVSADIRFVEARKDTRWAALALRDAGPEAPGVQIKVRQDATRRNGLELAARRPAGAGKGWRVFQTAAAARRFSPGKSHHLRIEARGDWIRVFFDSQKVIECPRGTDVSDSGRVGLRLWDAVVEFDNVVVARVDPLSADELRRLRPRPLVVAHRGFSEIAPENTLAAYRLAIEAGADMAECDVYLSSDGVPVLLHDANLKRTTGRDAPITSLPLSEIKKLDAGSWKSPKFAGERIPTLVEALKLVHNHLRFVIEIKQQGMEQEVIAAIHEAGVKPEDVMIFSFHRDVVEKIAKAQPRLPTTWLISGMPCEASARRAKIAQALEARSTAIGLPLDRVDPAIVRLAHESGLLVFVWTANDPADMRYLRRIGVDAIITNRPDVLLKILEQ